MPSPARALVDNALRSADAPSSRKPALSRRSRSGLPTTLGIAKVQPDDADILWCGEWMIVRAMRTRNGRMPAKEWFADLSKAERGRALACFRNVENSWKSGRPTGDRVGRVAGASCPILELRVTPRGGTPPHLRCMFIRRQNTMWVATGFTKQTNRLSRRDIAAADRVTAEWLGNDGRAGSG